MSTASERMAALLAKARAKAAAAPATKPSIAESLPKQPIAEAIEEAIQEGEQHTDMYGNLITYNKEQQQFIDLASEGKSCILIGAAGTGKTTCMQGAVQKLIHSGKAGLLELEHKHLQSGTPGIVVVAYTRRAVNNIRKAMPSDMKHNCITVHKLLEYAPHYYEITDDGGNPKKTMRFEPTYTAENPLSSSIHTIIVEESSMLGLELYAELIAALGHEVQWIFLGDLNQLPPVFGPAILGFKLLELPTVELTTVYRQALESPIIRLAHRILSGKSIPAEEYPDWRTERQLTIHPWKKKLSPELATLTLAAFFKKAYDEQQYSPETDAILMPFNKACGTIELNKHIANHIARRKQETTYEVIAGFNKVYFSVGDKVLYEKEDAEVVAIEHNRGYTGKLPQPESKHLDYWGHNPQRAKETMSDEAIQDIDSILEAMASAEDRVQQCSHIITVRLLETGTDVSLYTAADVNGLLHAYTLTVHKSQGSEWNKVFLCFHQSHATMLQRELLYTAVTRAKEELYIICEPETFTKGVVSQKVKGDTLAEKAEFFKGKVREADNILLEQLKIFKQSA